MRRPYTRADDEQLKQLAGTMPAVKIAAIMGRTKNSIHSRIERLGISGRLHGERHWNAKLPDMSAEMIRVLSDAGFTVNEIHRVLTKPVDISLQTVVDIAGGWRRTGIE